MFHSDIKEKGGKQISKRRGFEVWSWEPTGLLGLVEPAHHFISARCASKS